MKRFLKTLVRIKDICFIILVLPVLFYPGSVNAQVDHEKTATELLKNANQFFTEGEYDSALILYNRIVTPISALSSTKEKVRIAKACLQIANINTLKREYDVAESWFHKALDLADKGSILRAEVYQNLGSLFFLRENWEYAILNYRKSYLIYSNDPGKNSTGMYDLLASLGTSYSENGEYRKSFSCFVKADSLLRISGIHDPNRLAGLNINTGEILLKLDAPAKALKHYRMARKLGSDNGISSSDILIPAEEGMAECYSRLGMADSAMGCIEKCLKVVKSAGTCKDHETSRIFLFMGKIMVREKEWERSIKYFDQAIAILFPDPVIVNYQDMAKSYNPDLLDLYKILEYRGLSRLRLYLTNSEMDLLTGAYNDFLTALKICDRIGNDLGYGASRMIFQESTKSILDGAIESGTILNMKTGRPGLDELFSLADDRKIRILLGDMEENRFLELSAVPDSIRKEIKEVKDEIIFFSRKYIREESTPAVVPLSESNEMQNRLIDLHVRLDTLRNKIALLYPMYPMHTQNKKEGDPFAIRESLKSDEAIVEYLSADSLIYLFLVRKDGLLIKRIVLPPSFRISFMDCLHMLKGAETRNFSSLSKSLYNYLIAPVSSQLRGIRRLIIIPDEELSLFPFETLIRDDENMPSGPVDGLTNSSSWHYLLRDFEISYHVSAEAWFRETANTGLLTTAHRFAGFAPVFRNGTDKSLSVNPLPYSLKEITSIENFFGKAEYDAQLFSDTAATEKNFRLAAPACTHIHIATHSRVNDNDPVNSALVFSGNGRQGGSQDKDDGLLHLDEISNLKLNASLVVLSACATGEGKVTKTEGVLALTRGFYLAGASNVVYSLWSLPDHLTSGFMTNFYRSCFSGENYSAALREVKLKMLSRPETSLPYMWAGIVVLGR